MWGNGGFFESTTIAYISLSENFQGFGYHFKSRKLDQGDGLLSGLELKLLGPRCRAHLWSLHPSARDRFRRRIRSHSLDITRM